MKESLSGNYLLCLYCPFKGMLRYLPKIKKCEHIYSYWKVRVHWHVDGSHLEFTFSFAYAARKLTACITLIVGTEKKV